LSREARLMRDILPSMSATPSAGRILLRDDLAARG
jgi:hypothetical protein